MSSLRQSFSLHSTFETAASVHPSELSASRHNSKEPESINSYRELPDREEEENEQEEDYGGFLCTKFKIDSSQWRVIVSQLVSEYSGVSILATYVLFLTSSNGLQFNEGSAVALSSARESLGRFMGLLGGFLGDSYWGKYKTIKYGYYCSVLTTALLISSAFLSSRALLFASFVVSPLGGIVTPNISSFGADQIPSGEGAEQRLKTFFYVFYGFLNVGAVGTFLLAPIIQTTFGFQWVYVSCAVVTLLTLAILTAGRPNYTHAELRPNAVAQVKNVVMAARRSNAPSKPGHHWLDKAKEVREEREVEDVKNVFRILPILAMLPIFWTLYDQQSNTWTLQAEKMDRHLFGTEIPTASVGLLNPVLVIIFLFLFGGVIWPALGRCGFFKKTLDRMALGMLISSIAFMCSFLVERMLENAMDKGGSITILYQIPQYFLISMAEIMVSTESLEFAYSQAPKSMKAFITATYYVTIGIGTLLVGVLYNALNTFISIQYIFVVFACAMILNLGVFMIVKSRYVYIDVNKPDKYSVDIEKDCK